jgi:hypothetical protein
MSFVAEEEEEETGTDGEVMECVGGARPPALSKAKLDK